MRIVQRSVAVAAAASFILAASATASSYSVETTPDLLTVRMSRDTTLTDLPLLVADYNGFFAEQGVELENFSISASEAVQALLAGELDIAETTYHTMLVFYAEQGVEGPSDIIGLGETIVRPPYALMVADDVESIEDLEGRTVGISSPLDAGGVVVRDLLSEAGVDIDTVDFVPAGRSPDRLAALQSGAIDAAILVPPLNFIAQDAGVTELGWVPDMKGPDWVTSYFSFVASRAWAEENREAVVRFLQGVNQGLEWLHDPANRDETIQLIVDLDIADAQMAEMAYDTLVAGDPSTFVDEVTVNEQGFAENVRELESLDEVSGALPTPEDFLDPSFVEEASAS